MAKVKAFLVVAITIIALPAFTYATEWTVGDEYGWTPNYDYTLWTAGKAIYAVFNYDNTAHNVVEVDANGYATCSTSSNTGTYSSGSDRLLLPSAGFYYFVCQYHCPSYQKLAVYANPIN